MRSKIISASLFSFLALALMGTKACQEDYDFASNSNVGSSASPSASASASASSSASASASASASVSASASASATATPDLSGEEQSPLVSTIFKEVAEVTQAEEEKRADKVSSSTRSAGNAGNWLGKLYTDEEVQGQSQDSDGDGFSDKLENDYGSDAEDTSSLPAIKPLTNWRARLNKKDADHDGLTLTQEDENGTDTNKSDSDSDGVIDGFEVLSGSNPLDKSSRPENDPDNDGLKTDYENQSGSNPRKPDTDLDGLADGLEQVLGTNSTDNDSDKDGILDGKEYELGSDPLVAEGSVQK